MKVPLRTTISTPGSIVCPACRRGELRDRGIDLAGCDYCDCTFDCAIVSTLEQIAALPDASGKHACECGHPEMRHLPDGVFHCPACGLEVIPLEHPRPIKSGEFSCKERVLRKGEHLPTPS